MNEIPKTRASLLMALGRHSEDAWSEFLSVYENAIFRFCRAKGLQEADARDAVQDVMEAVMERLPTWDTDRRRGSFRGWIFRVARNIAIDRITQRARKFHATGDPRVSELLNQVPAAAETEFENEYQKSLFDLASKQVRGEVRDVTWRSFCLTALEGRPAEEIAAELGVPVGSVYTSKCRVVARIKARVAELEAGFGPVDE